MTHVHDGSAHTHDHPHSHQHPHDDAADPEVAQLGPSDPGAVVLDIGGDWGALILLAPESMLLDEIEISSVGHDDERTHVAIRERRSPNGVQWAAIYPRLLAGSYTLWNQQGQPAEQVEIVGGHVAQADWR